MAKFVSKLEGARLRSHRTFQENATVEATGWRIEKRMRGQCAWKDN